MQFEVVYLLIGTVSMLGMYTCMAMHLIRELMSSSMQELL